MKQESMKSKHFNKPLSLSLCPSNMWLHNAWKLLYMFIISWEGLIRPCLQGSCWVLLYLVTAGLLWRVRWGFSVWVTARKTLIIWTKNWKKLINCHEPWITLLTERFRQFLLNIWLDSWIDVWQSKLISWSLVFWHNWKCCSIMWFLVVAAIVLIFHSILTIFRIIILLLLLYNFLFWGVRVGVGAGHTEPEPNGPKIIQFDTKSDHNSSKNVSKIYILYLRDFLWIIWEIFFEML